MRPPALRIAAWQKWQGRAVAEIERKRQRKGLPLHLDFVYVVTTFGDAFLEFQSAVAHPFADALLLRVLQFAGKNGAREGSIAVPRGLWGVRVLSTDWAAVDTGLGERVYDALLSSGLAELAEPSAPPSAEPSAPDGARSACMTGRDVTGLDHSTTPKGPAATDPGDDTAEAPEPPSSGPRLSASARAVIQADGWRIPERNGGWSKWEPAIAQLLDGGKTLEEVGVVVKAAPIALPPFKALRDLEDSLAPRRRGDRPSALPRGAAVTSIYDRIGTRVPTEAP